MTLNELLCEHIKHQLSSLSWKCDGCPQVKVCEDQGEKGESRYCLPIIEAAILEKQSWKTLHKRGE